MRHNIRRTVVAILALVFVSAVGCVTVKPVQDPGVQALLYSEAGFNLAFFCLKGEPDVVLERTETAIETAKGMLETTEVTEMIDVMITYIEDSPQFRTQIEEYNAVITSSVHLLKGLIQIHIETTEDVEKVKKGLSLFLEGALDGVGELRRIKAVHRHGKQTTVNG